MQDLFTAGVPAPLPEKLRPSSLADILGQAHLIGPGAPLRVAYEQRTPHSFVLWGPPGTGKTSLALMAHKYFECELLKLSAVNSGAKDLRDSFEQIKQIWRLRQKRTILFIDEIHRMTSTNQDALLPGLEAGEFILVAATTEAPTIELSPALLSRMRVYRLNPLSEADLSPVVTKAYAAAGHVIPLSDSALAVLLGRCQGDARNLLNTLEVVLAAAKAANIAEISEEFLNAQAGEVTLRFDSFKSVFYNTTSALQKSIRGSDPDAALYWLARLLRGGADPKYVCRRLMTIASEDIGLADNQALVLATAAAQAFEKIGLPEGGIVLAHCVNYLALAPKSNHSYLSWKAVGKYLDAHPTGEVPSHLEDNAKDYRYSHNEAGQLSPGQSYLPDVVGREFWLAPDRTGNQDEQTCVEARSRPKTPNDTLEKALSRLELLRRTEMWLS